MEVGDIWSLWCLMADKVKGGVQDAGLFHSLFGQFINLVVSNDVCVSYSFVDGDIVVRFF